MGIIREKRKFSMFIMNFEVTFHLDGRGIYYDRNEPIMLDSLLVHIMAIIQGKSRPLQRDERPDDIQIPLMQGHVDGHAIWKASALFPVGKQFEGLQFWRKKFNLDFIEFTEGSPNLTNGVYREYNMPFPLLICQKLVAWASGDRHDVERLLKRNIKGLGKKRSQGKGCVLDITTQAIEEDWSFVKNGCATRFLPSQDGLRQVRVKPPYWNIVDRVPCCEIGEEYDITS